MTGRDGATERWGDGGWRGRSLFLVLLLVVLGVGGCDDDAAPDVSTDEIRVAAVSPAVARLVRDIGAGELVVGRHGFDIWSDPSIPVCGDQAGLNYEALVRARPTHVFLEWGSRAVPDRFARLAGTNGWIVEDVDLLTLDEIRGATLRLGASLGAPHDGGARDLAARMDDAWSAHATIDGGRVGRVLPLFGVSPVQALGPGSFHDQILERQGVARAIEEGGPYIEMDVEDVLHLKPDAIVLFMPRLPDAASATGVLDAGEIVERLGLLARLPIPAIENGRVALIDDPMALSPSSGMIGVAEDLAAILEGWSR